MGVQQVASGEVSVLGESAGFRRLAPPRWIRHAVRERVRTSCRFARTLSTSGECSVRRVTLLGSSASRVDSDLSDRRVASLSGGERSRVSLASCARRRSSATRLG